jgi:hypothetical protein
LPLLVGLSGLRRFGATGGRLVWKLFGNRACPLRRGAAR